MATGDLRRGANGAIQQGDGADVAALGITIDTLVLAPAEPVPPTQLVFIESNVPGAQALARGAAPGVVAVVLDAGGDGISQIAGYLARTRLTGLSAIDIVAHGSDGALRLGTGTLDAASLDRYRPQLAKIGAALEPGGALQLYGCDVAQDASGVAFIDALSAAIGGAAVAAASHLVGAAAQGGSWTLDVTTGADNAAAPFTAATEASYQGVLPTATFTSLYSFSNAGTAVAKSPIAGLFIDSNGNLIGIASAGSNGLFELTRNADGSYNTTPKFFGGAVQSYGPLIADANGNLYGLSYASPGSVFEINRNADGTYASTVNTLTVTGSSFATSSPGLYAPQGSVYRDAAGNLIGTASAGGAYGDGGVWELAYNGGPVSSSSSYTFKTLVNFSGTGTTGAPGKTPTGGFVADASGNLFGTTQAGGASSPGYGEVYELTYSNGSYTFSASNVWSFTTGTANGGPTYGTLAMDASGNLFGTTYGDGANGKGSIFELKKSGATYTLQTLYDASNAASGYAPYGSILLDTSGNLYGTFSVTNSVSVPGVVWELAYTGTGATGYAASTTTLLSFSGTTSPDYGNKPQGGLVADSKGNLLGTTYSGGSATGFTGGTVFELSGLGVVPLCFCRDTLIATPRGQVPVQDLRPGDSVLTLRNGPRPVKWIGTGQVIATRYRRTAASPVIVRKGALAPNMPMRDLRITKAHALFIDNVLVPVEFLVNHRSIVWDDHARATEIFHIELDSHDILLANGAPAESYRDDGNRWLFANASPGWASGPQPPCAPVLTGGPVVDAIWRRLLDRCGPAPALALTADADLHLLADGVRIDAARHDNATWTFALNHPPSELRIVSRSAVPAELGLARDPRELGVAVRRITILRLGSVRAVQYDDPALDARAPGSGWHGAEPDCAWRWTDGDTLLPAALLSGPDGAFSLALEVPSFARYRDEPMPARRVA